MKTEVIKFYISNGELIAHHIKENGKERIPLGARLEGEYFLKEGGDIILPYGILMAFLPLNKLTTAKMEISSVTKTLLKRGGTIATQNKKRPLRTLLEKEYKYYQRSAK